MLRFAVEFGGPIAVRYPRGTAYTGYEEYRDPIEYGKSEIIYEEKDIAVLSVGHMFEEAVKVWQNLKKQNLNCSLINARFVKPVDEELLVRLSENHRLIVVMEENVRAGGFGEHVTAFICRRALPVKTLTLAIPDTYVEHGSIDVLRRENGIDSETMTQKILEAVKEL